MSMGGSVQQPGQTANTGTGVATPGSGKGGAVPPQNGMASYMPPAPTAAGQDPAANPYTQSSQGMQSAYDTVYGALGQNSQASDPNFGTYNAHKIGAAPQGNYHSANTQRAQVASMDPALVQGVPQARQQVSDADRYRAVTQDSPDAIRQQMGRYQNPYQRQVINRTMNQMDKQRLQMLDQNRASAAAAGAFGGSRHGVVDAITNSEINQNMGDMAANLNMQGFNTAAGLAGQDISNQMSVASQNQAAQNAARQFGSAAQNAANQFNASQGNQLNQFNAANRFQNKVNNQASQNNANQFNATQANQMGQFNAGQANAMNQYNAGQRNNMSQYNASNRFNQNLANQSAINQERQFNAMQQNANSDRTFSNAMQGAGMLGNLANQSFGMGNAIAGNQINSGSMAQQQNQMLLDQAQQMYNNFISQPQNILQMRLASLGMNPMNNTGTTTSQIEPGWGQMFGNLLGAAGNAFQFKPIKLFG